MRFLIATLLLATAAHADEPDYVRFVEDDSGASLQTAITQFKDAKGNTTSCSYSKYFTRAWSALSIATSTPANGRTPPDTSITSPTCNGPMAFAAAGG
jgi:hypothetical protein